jgi:putative hydroxymethylpyrimidine transport system permease protein
MIYRFCMILSLILVWLGLKWGLHIPDYFLPSPLAVLQSLWINHWILWSGFVSTFVEAVSGFVLAVLFALVLGFLAYLIPVLGRCLEPLVVMSQAVPMLVIAPLVILWLGFGWSAKLVVIVLALFFPILASFMAGLQHVKPLYLDLAATMQATPWRLFRRVVFPASLPYLAAGLKVAVTWAVLSAIIAEWVGGSNGLGFIMQNALSRLDVALLFAALVVLVCSTLILYGLMTAILARLVFWQD